MIPFLKDLIHCLVTNKINQHVSFYLPMITIQELAVIFIPLFRYEHNELMCTCSTLQLAQFINTVDVTTLQTQTPGCSTIAGYIIMVLL